MVIECYRMVIDGYWTLSMIVDGYWVLRIGYVWSLLIINVQNAGSDVTKVSNVLLKYQSI